MKLTIHLPDELDDLFRKWAARKGRSVEEHALDVLLTYCEDQEDLDAIAEAKKEDDGTRISLEDVMRENGFRWDESGMVVDVEDSEADEERVA